MNRVREWVILGTLLWVGFPCFAQPALMPNATISEHAANDLSLLGTVLLSELQCVNCHQPPAQYEGIFPTHQRPAIHDAVRYLNPGFVEAMLLNGAPSGRGVHATAWGVNDLTDAERREVASAISAFLDGRNRSSTAVSKESYSRRPSRGQAAFETSGCVVCHGTTWATTATKAQLQDKYAEGGLAAYLLARSGGHASGHGMHLTVTEEQAADLEAFLSETDGPYKRKDSLQRSRRGDAHGMRHLRDQGCYQCHALDDAADGVASASSRVHPEYPDLREIAHRVKDGNGCLAPNALEGAPSFVLGDRERVAIRAALQSIAKEAFVQTPVQELRRYMIRWRCDACHERDGYGGTTLLTDASFSSSAEDLGDEGRLPPALDGVGRKLQPAALVDALAGGAAVRPYMKTQMPGLSRAYAEDLAARFIQLDRDPNERPLARQVAENQVGRNMWGRALVGSEGLGCITCHDLAGQKSLGIRALDLATVSTRLRPEWFRDYLIAPSQFRPGTRMPSFWPDGKPSYKGLGGSTDRQIDSIWAYLLELDQSRLPKGLVNDRDLLLRPGLRPIVFRTFLKGVGNHAIAVGYREGIHAAFDAQTMKWCLAWRGEFLSAESTWDDRFTPLAVPVGDQIMPLAKPALPRPDGMAFLGYTLDPESGVPAFRYTLDDWEVRDVMRPNGDERGSLVRELSANRKEKGVIWVVVAEGKVIRPYERAWLVDNFLTVRSVGPLRAVRGQPDRLEIRLGEPPASLSARVYYEW